MAETEGKLRERLDRIENALSGALTRLGQLQEAHDKRPTPASAEAIEALQTSVADLKTSFLSVVGKLSNGKQKESQVRKQNPGLWTFLFGDEPDSDSDSGGSGAGDAE